MLELGKTLRGWAAFRRRDWFGPIHQPTLRIMLIEDSKLTRTIQRCVLEAESLRPLLIDEASDGQDALSKVDAFLPDVILVDWDMPNMDGLTFVREYRSRNGKTPIIMVTLEASRDRVLQAIEAGVDDYIVMPFTPELLASRVHAVRRKSLKFKAFSRQRTSG